MLLLARNPNEVGVVAREHRVRLCLSAHEHQRLVLATAAFARTTRQAATVRDMDRGCEHEHLRTSRRAAPPANDSVRHDVVEQARSLFVRVARRFVEGAGVGGNAAHLLGAAFLVLCDTLARTLLAGRELPVGAITSLAGGPLFLWLLRRHRSRVFTP